MKPILHFFSQTAFIVLLGAGVSFGLLAMMPYAAKKFAAIDNSDAGVAVFTNPNEGQQNVNNNLPELAENASNAPATDALKQTGLASQVVDLERDLKKSGVSLNAAPQKDKVKIQLTPVKISDLGKFIKQSRVAKGVKIAALKAATGLTEQQILNIECGKTVPTPDIAIGFESILQIDVVYN